MALPHVQIGIITEHPQIAQVQKSILALRAATSRGAAAIPDRGDASVISGLITKKQRESFVGFC